MDFSEAMREESRWTKTENGAAARNTTDSALLDIFATIGSMRSRPEEEIIKKFEPAFQEDPPGAMRCLFYVRDIRGGLGERRVFRVLLPYMRLCVKLRRYIDVVEQRMSANKWDTIHYPAVPSRAMLNYRQAFARHDGERYQAVQV